MKAKSFAEMVCSIAGTLEAVGDRWGFLVLRDLSLGLHRFDDLKRSTDIPNTTLAQRLKHLQKTGLIDKTAYRDKPPRFEYALTQKGREFALVLIAMMQWGDRWDISRAGAPPVIPVSRDSRNRVRLVLLDTKTREPLALHRLMPRAGKGADKVARWRVSHTRASPFRAGRG